MRNLLDVRVHAPRRSCRKAREVLVRPDSLACSASLVLSSLALSSLALSSLVACGDEAKEDAAPGPEVPALGALELPVSLRSGDGQPSDARKVELTPAGIRVDDTAVLALESGRVPAAEQQDGVITKLKAALATPAKSRLALGVHSAALYETAAMVINTAHSAGVRDLSLQVRKPGASTDTGWFAVDKFVMTPRTHDQVAFPNVTERSWDEFTAAWQAVYDACRSAQTGSCAYVQENAAKGGELKIVLHAAGQGANVEFFRVGLTQEQLDAEAKAREAELAAKKEDVVQGRAEQTDIEQELLEGDPASEALFQFRAREAQATPSPVSATIQPLCGTKACGAVVSAEPQTLMVRVVSLMGAAFPDGTPAPAIAFEMPWTPPPKVRTPLDEMKEAAKAKAAAQQPPAE